MDGNYTGAEHTYIVATLENIKEPIITERYSLPESLKQALIETPSPFSSAYAECVFLRTYSRKTSQREKESWAETVIRVIEGTMEAYLTHQKRNSLSVNHPWLASFAEAMTWSFFNRQWSPPGRGLYAMGTDHTRKNGNAALNNCYACETKDLILATSWAMDQLMCGGGVGFDCSWEGVALQPDKGDTTTFVVPDTRQGWVAAVELLLRAYIPINGETGKFPIFDYSLIRPYGEVIHGFGGTASGPDPLKMLLQRIEIFLDTYLRYQEWTLDLKGWEESFPILSIAAQPTFKERRETIFLTMADRLNAIGAYTYDNYEEERKELVTALEIHPKTYGKTRLVVDIMNAVGCCVVAGNVRRCLPGSSLVHTRKGLRPITKVKIGDDVLTYKGYYKVNEFFEQGEQELVKIITQDGEFRCTPNHKMAVFVSIEEYEWKEASQLEVGDRLISIRSKVGYPSQQMNIDTYERMYGAVSVHSAEVITVVPDCIEATYDISVEDRHEFFCNGYLTHNSAMIAIADAGDSEFLDLKNNTINPERKSISWMSNNTVRFNKNEDFETYIPEISRRIQTNGEPGFFNLINAKKYGRYTETTYGEDPGNLLNPCVTGKTQVMTDQGWQRADSLIGKQFDALVNGKVYPSTLGGFWKTGDRETYKIILANGMSVEATSNHRFLARTINPFYDTRGIEPRWLCLDEGLDSSKELCLDSLTSPRQLYSAIASIVPQGVKAVYDCTITKVHCFNANGIIAHNCGEILLQSFEPCTLATICPSNCIKDGKIDMDLTVKAAQYATFYATTVTCVKHHWNVTNAVIARNRRIGVSLTGIANIYEEYGFTYLTTLCRHLYHEIRSFNTKLAAQAGIPRAIRVTTVKPEGTLSIIMEVNAGVHFPICRYARRRIGIAKNDPLLEPLKEAGYTLEESTYNNTMVYAIFPIANGACRSEREVSIYEQFGISSALQRSYSDNSVSFTGHFSIERESSDVERVIAMFAPQIKTCSLLPYSDDLSAKPAYAHMPFEEISKEEYLALKNRIKPVVWQRHQGDDAHQPKFCTNDTCTI